MARKTIQLSTVVASSGEVMIFALADDGTMWSTVAEPSGDPVAKAWRQVPQIPPGVTMDPYSPS